MAQTQQRAGAAKPPTEADKPVEAKPKTAEERLAELEVRVAWIEDNTPGLPKRETAEADQEARDNEILSRQPNSYEEAVAFEAALERRKARRKPDGEETKDEG
jgi:hypothetical protein